MQVPASWNLEETLTCQLGVQPEDFRGLALLFADFFPQMFYPQLLSIKTEQYFLDTFPACEIVLLRHLEVSLRQWLPNSRVVGCSFVGCEVVKRSG